MGLRAPGQTWGQPIGGGGDGGEATSLRSTLVPPRRGVARLPPAPDRFRGVEMPIVPTGYRMCCDHDDCENGYCDHPADGDDEAECVRWALKVGWVEVSPGVWHCPSCVKRTSSDGPLV